MTPFDIAKIKVSDFKSPYQESITKLKEIGLDILARKEISESVLLTSDTQESSALKFGKISGWNECLDFIFNLYSIYKEDSQMSVQMSFTKDEDN